MTTEGKIQDMSDPSFPIQEQLENRTLIDGFGNLSVYPIADRITGSTLLYVYFGADFSIEGLSDQDYRTETLTIEVFHE